MTPSRAPGRPRSERAEQAIIEATLELFAEKGAEGLCVPSKFYSNLRSGRPVIALMSPGAEVALVIDEAKCGAVVPVGDADALIAALQEMRANPEETSAMGRRAREVFLKQYSMELIVEKLHGVLCKAAFR